MANTAFTPRFIRMRDAPAYLGMNEELFNEAARPFLPEVAIGQRGRAFDIRDLDAFADEYKRQNAIDKSALAGQSLARGERRGTETWRKSKSPASTFVAANGTSTRKSTDSDFAKVVALATGKKRKST